MATIKAIEGRSIHQIQSGQVIVDLCSVVKELVENSLDAGATSIEVRFRNHGLEAIEVYDSGKGIAPDDFETIALKHYTSKLSSYEDLTSLDTFGFRGEALSSLCALSKFHIITARAEDGPKGTRLDFETSGKLKGRSITAAQKGTTVFIENLFHNLPVRRKELEKNIKREYGKVINLLHAYACIGVGVRLSVSNQMPKGKKMLVFSTNANTTTKENIANVYGAKNVFALAKLDLKLEMQSSQGPITQGARNRTTQDDQSLEVLVQGHISKPVFGEGRSAPDRQMFFVNSRPCMLPQVSKAINEVYKSFNVSQSPFIFANFIMDTNAYDVNVSPDKRTIMLHDQPALLERLKASLTEMFDNTNHTMPHSSLSNRKLPTFKPLTSGEGPSPNGPFIESSRESTPEGPGTEVAHVDIGESLVSKWAGRHSEIRKDVVPSAQQKSSSNGKSGQFNGKDGKLTGDALLGKNAVALDRNADGRGEGIYEGHSSEQENDEKRDDRLGDKHINIHSEQAPQTTAGVSISGDKPEAHAAALEQPAQEPIQAIATSSQKGTPGPVQNAFDRMRPKRTPQQTAEITIGETTTTTTIGSGPPLKRQRVHAPKNPQAIAAFGCSPALANGLRSFAAPGTQLSIGSSDRSDDSYSNDEEAEEEQQKDNLLPSSSASEASDSEMSEDLAALEEREDPADDVSMSDEPDEAQHMRSGDGSSDEDYMDEDEKKLREDEKVARLIQEAEATAARPTEQKLRRASQTLKNSTGRKDSTYQLATSFNASIQGIQHGLANLRTGTQNADRERNIELPSDCASIEDTADETNAESKLSLTVLKEDFGRMTIIGQFNLGFILAVRPASQVHDQDELFIIDQHAADEKYNYERLQRTVTIQSQRLVRPKLLELSAVEEELVLNHQDALKANGFEIEVQVTSNGSDGDSSLRHFNLLTLPISKEKTFELSDLEELLYLLSERAPGSSDIPRPKKVQRMLAMRACRSSIMVGKTLTMHQMQRVVRNMGEMDKPWNCPHGRPTMRHLAGLGDWIGWQEEELVGHEGLVDRTTDWKAWLDRR